MDYNEAGYRARLRWGCCFNGWSAVRKIRGQKQSMGHPRKALSNQKRGNDWPGPTEEVLTNPNSKTLRSGCLLGGEEGAAGTPGPARVQGGKLKWPGHV